MKDSAHKSAGHWYAPEAKLRELKIAIENLIPLLIGDAVKTAGETSNPSILWIVEKRKTDVQD